MILLVAVIILVLIFFAYVVFRYHDKPGNKAPFKPEWDNNQTLEIIWWGIPIVIIGILGFFTVRDTFTLAEPPSKDVTHDHTSHIAEFEEGSYYGTPITFQAKGLRK